ncbi:MAG: SnoaL-like domain-containing protein [Nocardioidaceae bacterium]|nr:SnoaL-like domain-containing protein [Nocardioidaceae bacterium]
MGHSDTHRQMHDAFNTRDFDTIAERMAPGFIFEDLPQGVTVKTTGELVDYLRSWSAAFSDASIGSARYSEGPDHSVALFHARGHNDGAFGPMQPTGKAVDVPFCEVAHYASDGSVLSVELYYDRVTLLEQLGVMPAAG